MADLRLHIRPRLGAAMTLASEGIVPMAARAISRRAGPGRAPVAWLPGHTDPEDPSTVPSGAESPAAIPARTSSEAPRRSKDDAEETTVSRRTPAGPWPKLVPPGSPDEPLTDGVRERPFVASRPVSNTGPRALLTLAAEALARRQTWGATTIADRPEQVA